MLLRMSMTTKRKPVAEEVYKILADHGLWVAEIGSVLYSCPVSVAVDSDPRQRSVVEESDHTFTREVDS